MQYSGGYVREFSARIVMYGKKVPLEKLLEFYFGLKHPKMTTSEVGG